MCLAVPGKIISIDDNDPLQRVGRVSFGGTIREINIAFVPEATVGNYVLAHAGVAISLVDEQEANHVFEYLSQIEELNRSGNNRS